MTVTRRIVTLLLIFSVILGYSETPSLRNAVGVVTSYSTATSTTYTYEFSTWTSIRYVTTTLTALTQTEMSGPYVEIKGGFSYRYYADGAQIADMMADAKIKNLMTTMIRKGMIRLELASLSYPFATEEVLVPFWEIKPGETVDVKQGVQITKTFYIGEVKMYFLRAEITCWGLTTMAPVAYTLSGMQTRTIVTTYTTAFTQQEPAPIPQTATEGNPWLWIIPIAAVAVIGALFLLKRRIPTKPRTQNLCASCGAPMEAADDFCTNCGKKRST